MINDKIQKETSFVNRYSKNLFLVGLFLIGFLLPSCLLFRDITVEEDTIYATKRVKAGFTYQFAQETNSPLIQLDQKIIKEIKNDSNDSNSVYRVYDILQLKTNSFKLDNKMFVIVDDEPFRLDIESIDSETVTKIKENRKDILTSDSTKVSVVTGYKENQSVDYKLTYLLDNSIVEKIKLSKIVMLRYYAGPDMITIKIAGYNLNYLKEAIVH